MAVTNESVCKGFGAKGGAKPQGERPETGPDKTAGRKGAGAGGPPWLPEPPKASPGILPMQGHREPLLEKGTARRVGLELARM